MDTDKPSTAIVLSYLRPGNIQRICETILEIENVSQLIVCNNNPDINLKEYLNVTDERFLLVNQKIKTGPIKRFELAKAIDTQYCFSIDDDLFLNKVQIEFLMNKLIENPDMPHGFWGQNYLVSNNHISFEYGIINKAGGVDILNRAYFFTKLHIKEFFNLLIKANLQISDVGSSDDIVLSFSGVQRPQLHDIGDFLDCPTSNTEGIAQWKSDNFDMSRAKILKSILRVKSFK